LAGLGATCALFAFRKPREFLVLDSVSCSGQHEFVEHVHLSPTFARVTRDGSAVVAQASEEGPSLVVIALDTPDRVTLVRGQDDPVQGFTFPEFNVAVENTDIEFEYDRSADDGVTLGYLVQVNPPGRDPDVPLDARLERADGLYSVSWSDAEGSHSWDVPAD
jgi:hypothetical protein